LTDLLIRNLKQLETWPTIKRDSELLEQLQGINRDAKKYVAAMTLDFTELQLYALQDEILYRKPIAPIDNEFGTWLYYKELNERFLQLVNKSALDNGSDCVADFDCKSDLCWKRECVAEIEDSKDFYKFEFALVFQSQPIRDYAIDAGAQGAFKDFDVYRYELNRSGAQQFKAEIDGTIVHVPTGRVLAVEGSEFQPGNRIILEARDGTLGQQWVLFKDGRIANRKSGFYITLPFDPNWNSNTYNPIFYRQDLNGNFGPVIIKEFTDVQPGVVNGYIVTKGDVQELKLELV